MKGVAWFEGLNKTVITIMRYGMANNTYSSSVVIPVTQKLLYYYVVVDCDSGFCNFWHANAHVNIEVFEK